MDAIEDIIYLLAIIVAIGVGIFQRINKSFAKTAQKRPVPPEPMAKTTDDWQEPLQQMATESFPELQFVYTETPEVAEEEQMSENQYVCFTEQPGSPEPPAHHAQVVIEQTEEDTASPIIDFTDMDEVKKAVVAGEIFNRKY